MLDAAFIDSTVLVPIEKERKIKKDSEEVKQVLLFLTYSFFQQPSNSDCQPLNNAIVKENTLEKTTTNKAGALKRYNRHSMQIELK